MIRLKRISFLAFAVVFASLVGAKTTALAMEEVGTFRSAVIRAGASAYLEKRVDSTLCRLTLEEKVGQMMEVVIDVVGTTNAQGLFEIDSNKLDSLFSLYKVGSLLNAPGTVAPTARQWESYMAKIQEASMRILGIPCIFGLDQNHGSTYIQGGTLFPQNINVAATFNRDLARRMAEATAYETRAVSVPWTYSPTVDLGRDPRWSRMYENFGEDCLLNAVMGREMVLGFQRRESG